MAPSPQRSSSAVSSSVYPPLDFASFSWIFVGDKDLAKSLPLLRQRHIAYVINCTPEVASGGVPHYHLHARGSAQRDGGSSQAAGSGRPIEYTRIDMVDNATEKLSRHFERFWEQMERVRVRESGNVLVHCNQGVSRSVAMVASYLIRFFKMAPPDALALIQVSRPVARPNDAFMQQLRELHEDLVATGAYPPNAVAFSLADTRHDQEALQAHETQLAARRRAFAAQASAQAVAAAFNRRVIGPARPQPGPEEDPLGLSPGPAPRPGPVMEPSLPPHLQKKGLAGTEARPKAPGGEATAAAAETEERPGIGPLVLPSLGRAREAHSLEQKKGVEATSVAARCIGPQILQTPAPMEDAKEGDALAERRESNEPAPRGAALEGEIKEPLTASRGQEAEAAVCGTELRARGHAIPPRDVCLGEAGPDAECTEREVVVVEEDGESVFDESARQAGLPERRNGVRADGRGSGERDSDQGQAAGEEIYARTASGTRPEETRERGPEPTEKTGEGGAGDVDVSRDREAEISSQERKGSTSLSGSAGRLSPAATSRSQSPAPSFRRSAPPAGTRSCFKTPWVPPPLSAAKASDSNASAALFSRSPPCSSPLGSSFAALAPKKAETSCAETRCHSEPARPLQSPPSSSSSSSTASSASACDFSDRRYLPRTPSPREGDSAEARVSRSLSRSLTASLSPELLTVFGPAPPPHAFRDCGAGRLRSRSTSSHRSADSDSDVFFVEERRSAPMHRAGRRQARRSRSRGSWSGASDGSRRAARLRSLSSDRGRSATRSPSFKRRRTRVSSSDLSSSPDRKGSNRKRRTVSRGGRISFQADDEEEDCAHGWRLQGRPRFSSSPSSRSSGGSSAGRWSPKARRRRRGTGSAGWRDASPRRSPCRRDRDRDSADERWSRGRGTPSSPSGGASGPRARRRSPSREGERPERWRDDRWRRVSGSRSRSTSCSSPGRRRSRGPERCRQEAAWRPKGAGPRRGWLRSQSCSWSCDGGRSGPAAGARHDQGPRRPTCRRSGDERVCAPEVYAGSRGGAGGMPCVRHCEAEQSVA
ncbi:dual specificity phosphatase, catalytic domain-containing protein [Besnoitia besnoiti]|uniref:protein-tyrosine-phosphatase n=1 Tax=Besnoitia besnoiti TaxID=94643 RepID=A0A2A9M5T0_BESBE|nr:dual specificity phosphatase, catalytic domain-containing protein [Besnoitia besnoiti]PFH33828.1 dual specificity phosphatase, catalytic domain-containing protein [Besnoitia besnoiti]